MKRIYFTIVLLLLVSTCFSQPIPQDSLYLGQTRPGSIPVVFQLQSSSGLRPVERICISSDGKEIYYCELDSWPISISRVKCYKYISNKWQGPFVVFEGFVAPGLSVNDSTLYMQRDTNGVSRTFYSTRTGTGWSTPVRLLSSNLQSHYFQETQLKNYYLASTPGGNSDICKLVINNQDTTIQSLGKPINNTATENDFFIARDESYIIFFRLSSPFDLFISYHKNNGKWTNPKSLGPNINTNIYDCCPFVTGDNKYLFFTRGNWPMNTYYTYWVKVDNIIDSLHHTNFIPYLVNQIPNQTDSVGVQFSYTIPDSTFIDDDGNNTITYSATLSDGSNLPSWLNFNPGTRTLSGTPVTAGTSNIKVTVTDNDSAKALCEFALNVYPHTAIDPKGEQIVNEYKLFQNYPNPFNPSTVISYSLLRNSFVSVKIYNILGKEIATLVNSVQTRGLYNVTLKTNSLNLSSGIYIYTLTATETNSNKVFRETKVMNYIK
ncbi:MAG: putative Ig domain-containing protein [Ignavibacteriae bacterium]|nr:putative Ig domain-containing protein [Ignavibacteriota bacterium]